MSELSDSRILGMRSMKPQTCPECGELVAPNYCRTCQAYFSHGHRPDCPEADHQDHAAYVPYRTFWCQFYEGARARAEGRDPLSPLAEPHHGQQSESWQRWQAWMAGYRQMDLTIRTELGQIGDRLRRLECHVECEEERPHCYDISGRPR